MREREVEVEWNRGRLKMNEVVEGYYTRSELRERRE